MNARSLRRLATDHASLHNLPLPPNYLFDPRADPSSDLTQLDILLAGPPSTPYEHGVFKLHLAIPATYPSDPPKAFFRTKIFHPNIEPETGAVCVETLKRDWENKLTLRDVLVTISCLLVQPNASSALNAEAGGMLEQGGGSGWEGFERRARLMVRLQAGVPKELRDAVKEAQLRGEDKEEEVGKQEEKKDSGVEEEEQVRPRRRRGVGRLRETLSMEDAISARERKRTPSPTSAMTRAPPPRPFVVQSSIDDVFGSVRLPHPSLRSQQVQTQTTSEPAATADDSEMQDLDQENDSLMFPVIATKPIFHPTPARNGPSMPLGELRISSPSPEPNDFDTTIEGEDSMEAEYPPSPRKSPVKQRNTSAEHYGEILPSPRKDCPASPRKQSPVKQQKQQPQLPPAQFRPRSLFAPPSEPSSDSNIFAIPSAPSSRPNMFRAESSRTASSSAAATASSTATGQRNNLFFTPNNALHPAMQSTTTIAGHQHQQTPSIALTDTDESEFEISFEVLRQSERKRRNFLASPPKRKVRGSRPLDWTPLEPGSAAAPSLSGFGSSLGSTFADEMGQMGGGEGASKDDDGGQGVLRFGSHGGVLGRGGVVRASTTAPALAPALAFTPPPTMMAPTAAAAAAADATSSMMPPARPRSPRTSSTAGVRKSVSPKGRTKSRVTGKDKATSKTSVGSRTTSRSVETKETSSQRELGKERTEQGLERQLWEACGGDVERWNRGDFGEVFEIARSRW